MINICKLTLNELVVQKKNKKSKREKTKFSERYCRDHIILGCSICGCEKKIRECGAIPVCECGKKMNLIKSHEKYEFFNKEDKVNLCGPFQTKTPLYIYSSSDIAIIECSHCDYTKEIQGVSFIPQKCEKCNKNMGYVKTSNMYLNFFECPLCNGAIKPSGLIVAIPEAEMGSYHRFFKEGACEKCQHEFVAFSQDGEYDDRDWILFWQLKHKVRSNG